MKSRCKTRVGVNTTYLLGCSFHVLSCEFPDIIRQTFSYDSCNSHSKTSIAFTIHSPVKAYTHMHLRVYTVNNVFLKNIGDFNIMLLQLFLELSGCR